MRNYPNMDYCMNENTALAMQQILEAMVEEPDIFCELRPDELRAFRKLQRLCEEFVDKAEIVEDMMRDLA